MQRPAPEHAGSSQSFEPSARHDDRNWYVLIKDQQFGPLDLTHLAKLAHEGTLKPDVLVWRPGFANWVSAETVRGFFPPSAEPRPGAVSELADLSASPNERSSLPPDDADIVDIPDIPAPPIAGEPRAETKKKHRNYLARHWLGELSLPVSYWINGLLANVVAVLVVAAIAANLNLRDEYNPAIELVSLVGIWTALAVVLCWQVVGTWRSATNYQRTKSLWGSVAKVFIVIGVVRSMVDFAQYGVPRIKEVYDIYAGDERVGKYAFRVLRDGQELEFSGGITFGAAKEFERFLDAMGGVRLIHLNSLGGRILEAQRIGDLIRKRNLSTYVSHQCMSACTIIFLSGRERLVTAQSRIGFHQPDLAGLSAEERRDMIAQEEKRLRALGLSATFAHKANLAPPSDMWVPTTSELLAERAATRVVDAADFAFSGVTQSDLTDEKIEQVLLGNALYASIRRVDAATYKRILDRVTEGVRRGRTLSEMRSDISPLVDGLFFELLPYASDENLIAFTRSLVGHMATINRSSPSDCYFYVNPDKSDASALKLMSERYKDLLAEEGQLEDRMFVEFSGKDRSIPTEKEVATSWNQIASVLRERFGDDVELMWADRISPEKHRAYCDILIALYGDALKLPPVQAAPLLRYVFANR